MIIYTNSYGSRKKGYNLVVLYLFVVVFISFGCGIYLLFDNKAPEYFSLLPILPITFAFGSFIAFNAYHYLFKKLSITIIIVTYFIRMVVIPFVIALGDYSMLFGNYSVVIPYDLLYMNMNNATLLICYEGIVVFIALATSKFKNESVFPNNKSVRFNDPFGKKSPFFIIVIILMLMFIGLSLMMYPILGNYVSFFVATSIQSDLANSAKLLTMRESVPSAIYWSYIFVLRFLQVFLPILVLQYIYIKLGNFNQKRAVILSIIIIALVFSFMTPEKITSVLLAITLFIVSYMLYPRIRRTSPLILVILIASTIVGLLFKSGIYRSNGDTWEFVSATLNAYFGGPLNVTASLSMQQNISFQVIIADILNSMPFMSHFLKEWSLSTPEYFNNAIKGEGSQVTKIIPMVGQGYFYFGFILAPMFSFFSIKISILFEKMIGKNTDMFKSYIYIFATGSFAISPVLYNLNIMLSNFWYILMYLLLIKLAGASKMEKTIL